MMKNRTRLFIHSLKKIKPAMQLQQIVKLIFTLNLFCFSSIAFAQQTKYIDGRPDATKRIICNDEGIVMRYNGGPDSCDFLGAREAVVNYENGTYYLFYDGAGKTGWLACLAESKDLKNWIKKGLLLQLGANGKNDSKSASSPWVIKDGKTWHMFYLGTPNTSAPPERIPSFPYLTMKAKATSLEGPWIKQYDITPFFIRKNTFYASTASPGFIIKDGENFVQFFSGSVFDTVAQTTKRTLGIAITKDLDKEWKIMKNPVVPLEEQVENSSLFFDETAHTWYLFTNHIGINKEKTEYTDAIWVYWSKDLYHWNATDKAIVLDSVNCNWAKGAIGMPSVMKVGKQLALLYDAPGGSDISHMRRNIGLAWIPLPISFKKY
jgi:predicted GH43/DUF377 family glycosyl hydrolase